MKRIQLIAVALCLIMIVTVGAGAVAAQQDPRHAGESGIYFFNVAKGTGSGTLKIDLKQKTFLFDGKGFTPSQAFSLQAKTTSGATYVFGSAKSGPSGNLHAAGTWYTTPAAQPSSAGFSVDLVGATTFSGTIQRINADDKDYTLVYTDASNQQVTLYLDPSSINPSNTLPSVIPSPVALDYVYNIVNGPTFTVQFVYQGTPYSARWSPTTLNTPSLTYEAHFHSPVIGMDQIFGTVWLNSWDATQGKYVQTTPKGVQIYVLWESSPGNWIGYNTGTTDSQGKFCIKGPNEPNAFYKVNIVYGDLNVQSGVLESSSSSPC